METVHGDLASTQRSMHSRLPQRAQDAYPDWRIISMRHAQRHASPYLASHVCICMWWHGDDEGARTAGGGGVHLGGLSGEQHPDGHLGNVLAGSHRRLVLQAAEPEVVAVEVAVTCRLPQLLAVLLHKLEHLCRPSCMHAGASPVCRCGAWPALVPGLHAVAGSWAVRQRFALGPSAAVVSERDGRTERRLVLKDSGGEKVAVGRRTAVGRR